MGKMKELYQAMKDADWKGTPEEYLKWWLAQQAKKIDKKNENNNNNNTSNDSSMDQHEDQSK